MVVDFLAHHVWWDTAAAGAACCAVDALHLYLRRRCGPMVLDALIKIKSEQDASLTFRR
jgi:hypothetical protein